VGERRPRDGTILAARILGEIGDDRAAAPLGTLIETGAAPARIEAARALGRLGLMAGLAPLRGALADSDPAVRLAAGESIVTIAGTAACELIRARAGAETDAGVRDGLRRVLSGLPPPGCDRMPSPDRR